MMRSVAVAAAAMYAVQVDAACPNQCSGHGTCGSNDICTCYPNWNGPDCSLRTCAFGNSWALDAANPHAYEECSGAGLCDRETGECKCFQGYSGNACQRRACPNDCSGHGMCRLLGELDTVVPYSNSNWDSDHIQACVCDSGFFGTDCSQRVCPTGDDPLTLCDTTQKGQVQEIRVTLGSQLDYDPTADVSANSAYVRTLGTEGMDVFGTSSADNFYDLQEEDIYQIRVGYTDPNGQVYYAPTAAKAVFSRTSGTGADRTDNGADSLEVALENIPGMKVRNVQIAGEFTNAATANGVDRVLEKRYLVTFVPHEASSSNYGNQNNLICDSGYGCSTAGCQPMVKMPFLYRYAATKDEQTSVDSLLTTSAVFEFYTGDTNTDADFSSKKFIRLADDSMPRLPPGVPVDDGVSAESPDRYDVRVVVAVQDPADALNQNSPIDVYWTKVVFTHTNITTDVFEYAADSSAGVFSASKAADFQGTLNGFTYRGQIPSKSSDGKYVASIPDAPGAVIEFPDQDMISNDQSYKFFEILVKLPSCKVTPLLDGTEFTGVGGAALTAVSSQIENIECSNRGQCNRETGVCECFEGYYGLACHRVTTLL